MSNILKTTILALILVSFFSGCGLMPYQENFSCQADLGAGSCGMVRDNYRFGKINEHKDFIYSFDDNKTSLIVKNNTQTKIDDCSQFATNINEFHNCQQKYEYYILRKAK